MYAAPLTIRNEGETYPPVSGLLALTVSLFQERGVFQVIFRPNPPENPASRLKTRTVAIGSARNDYVENALEALVDETSELFALVKDDRAPQLAMDRSVRTLTFKGAITWKNTGVLRLLRKIRPDRIIVIVGDQFIHANVLKALCLWMGLGVIGNAQIYISYSNDPSSLEYWRQNEPSYITATLLAFGASAWLAVYALTGFWGMLSVLALLCLWELALTKGQIKTCKAPSAGTDDPKSAPAKLEEWKTLNLPLITADPLLGWKTKAMDSRVTVFEPESQEPRSWVCRVGAFTGRFTADDAKKPEGFPVISVYGGGFIFGEALNDDETCPWLLQAALPGYCVRNHGVPGYSLYQMYLACDARMKHEKPALVVIDINNALLQESLDSDLINLGDTPRTAPRLSFSGSQITDHPPVDYLRIPMSGTFQTVGFIEKAIFRWSVFKKPSPEKRLETEKLLLGLFRALCNENGAVLIVLYRGAQDNPLFDYLKKSKFNLANPATDVADYRGNAQAETARALELSISEYAKKREAARGK